MKIDRNTLKRLWFSLPIDENKVERKEIIVEKKYGHVEIVSDGPGGYNSFKTNQGDNALEYAIVHKNGWRNTPHRDYTEYKLIIK